MNTPRDIPTSFKYWTIKEYKAKYSSGEITPLEVAKSKNRIQSKV